MKELPKSVVALLIFFVIASFIYVAELFIAATETSSHSAKQKITIYSKPTCSYCVRAKKLLDNMEIEYQDIDISWMPEQRERLYKKTGATTVPYIFINDIYVGGYTDLQKLADDDKLTKMLE